MWLLKHVLFGLCLRLTPALTAATAPEAGEPVVVTDCFRFGHEHRPLFADQAKSSDAKIAVAYSVPSIMYYNYAYANVPPVTALSIGTATSWS